MKTTEQARAAHAGTKAEKLRLLPPWPEGTNISDEPLRDEVRRGITHPGGHILSAKMGRELQYISPNERAFLVLAEVDPNVIRIADRPVESKTIVDGKVNTHFPDYAVLVGGVAEIHEVKSDNEYSHQDLVRRLALHAQSLEARGCLYSVALRSELFLEPLYGRAETLWPCSTFRISPAARAAVLMIVRRGPIIIADLMAELEAGLGSERPKRNAVLGMAARGEIFCDLGEPVGPETVVRPFDPHAMPNRLLPIRRPVQDLLEIYKTVAA